MQKGCSRWTLSSSGFYTLHVNAPVSSGLLMCERVKPHTHSDKAFSFNCYLLRAPETPAASQTLDSNLDVEFLMRLVAPRGFLQEPLHNVVSAVLKDFRILWVNLTFKHPPINDFSEFWC